MDFFGVGESIECASAYVIAKKILPSPPMNHEFFGRCMKYVCSRDGGASIVKELDPKISKIQNSISRLNLGDKIQGKSFYVLHKGHKPLKPEKTRFSGQHNGNEMTTPDYTYAEIRTPFPGKPEPELLENFISPFIQLSK
jgi:hypothetical protein